MMTICPTECDLPAPPSALYVKSYTHELLSRTHATLAAMGLTSDLDIHVSWGTPWAEARRGELVLVRRGFPDADSPVDDVTDVARLATKMMGRRW